MSLGSGHHAQTILTLAPGLDGQTEGIEHRVSCYPGGRIGLTPGHSKMKPQSALEFFGDSSRGTPLERCIYCHTTSARIVGEGIEDLVPSINCEKCHGPGSEHVRLARTDSKPPPYSVGRDTWDTESEMQLCGDCHRLPRMCHREGDPRLSGSVGPVPTNRTVAKPLLPRFQPRVEVHDVPQSAPDHSRDGSRRSCPRLSRLPPARYGNARRLSGRT